MAIRDILAGRAVVELGLRNKLNAALDRVQARLRAFGASVAATGRGLAVGGGALTGFATAAVTPVLAAARSFQTWGDSIQKMAIRTGVATDTLAELGFAAEQSGTDLASVEKGLQRMQRTITDAGDGMASASDALESLGLSSANLSRLSPGEQFEVIAAAVARIPDATTRAARAMQIFGRSGASLLPLMRDDIAKLRAEARSLGVTLSQEDADSAAALGDALNRVARTGQAAFRLIGAAVAPAITKAANMVAEFVSGVTRWINQNRTLFVSLTALAIGVGAVGGALTGAGLALGLLGFAISSLAPIIAFAFSPLGAAVGVLLGLAAAAYYFRDSLAAILAPLAPTFSAIGSTLGNLAGLFRDTFGGIVTALASGDLAAAGSIAWSGLLAVFYEGLAGVGRVAGSMLALLSAWLPGFDSLRDYVGQTFAAITQAIMAGRWDLAGQILMLKLRVAIAAGWSSVRFVWESFTVGLVGLFDRMGNSIKSAWRTVVFEIADWIVWAGEKVGLVSEGARAELEKMKAAAQATDDQALAGREAARIDAANARVEAARRREQELRDQLAAMEAEAAASFAAAGSPTLDSNAAAARQALEDALAAATESATNQPLIDSAALEGLGQSVESSDKATRKFATSGTFSAAGALALGLGANRPAEETAANTKTMVGLLKRLNSTAAGLGGEFA